MKITIEIDLPEAYAGEVKAHVLQALMEQEAATRQTKRQRHHHILKEILAANPSNGELASRREIVREAFRKHAKQNAAFFKTLKSAGIALASDNSHLKLSLGTTPYTLPKTPSDHRSAKNAEHDMIAVFF